MIAVNYYPGGSQFDKNSIGFDWGNNYLCNLFNEKAVNGSANASRFWAIAGMFFLCASVAIFFIEFSKKISSASAAGVIKYCGAAAMAFAFLVVTPLHDAMVTLSGTLALLSIFYITVFIFKSRLIFFKILSVICLLLFYSSNYIYYSGSYLEFLPIMQKATLLLILLWALGLHYFTTAVDFQFQKNGKAITVDNMKANR